MMPYITILGAGSTMFARQLMTDILHIEGLDEGCFALVDIVRIPLYLRNEMSTR
jgi:alpha-galactosidase